ncbi:MAG: hypothetical protein V7K32_08690 [Nostoc sp.]|uniref:hypothetical protein n=1 Tax=Nostoc sp. TaxID=1180 RepID=UPI002FFB454E
MTIQQALIGFVSILLVKKALPQLMLGDRLASLNKIFQSLVSWKHQKLVLVCLLQPIFSLGIINTTTTGTHKAK